MSVVARLSCHAVEHTAFGTSLKMQPVVPQDDPHNEETKQFFAATPAGNVTYTVAGDEAPFSAKPKDQFYLRLTPTLPEGREGTPVKVTSLSLNGWAAGVKLTAEKNGDVYQPLNMEFTIRNELAAEQFQPGAEFYATFEKIEA